MSNPRAFYEGIVKPSYAAWLADPLSEYKARNAAAEANNMAERLYHHFRSIDPAVVSSAKTPGAYRQYLATHECPDFQLVWDVADSHKHVKITKRPAHISSADQSRVGRLTWKNAGDTWADADYTWEETSEIMLVTLDSGEQRTLKAILASVMAMYDALLAKMGL